MGLEITFIRPPFKRGLRMMETGQVDLMTGLLRRPEREVYLAFIDPPYKTHSNKAFYRVRTGDIRVRTYEDLAGLRIGTGIGTRYFPRFDNDQDLIKIPIPKNQSNFQKLLRGHLDLVIYTETTGDYQLARLGLRDRIVKTAYLYQKENPVYFGMSKESPFLKKSAEFGSHTRELLEQGLLEQIKKGFLKHGKANPS